VTTIRENQESENNKKNKERRGPRVNQEKKEERNEHMYVCVYISIYTITLGIIPHVYDRNGEIHIYSGVQKKLPFIT
jgi:hypothetical protein